MVFFVYFFRKYSPIQFIFAPPFAIFRLTCCLHNENYSQTVYFRLIQPSPNGRRYPIALGREDYATFDAHFLQCFVKPEPEKSLSMKRQEILLETQHKLKLREGQMSSSFSLHTRNKLIRSGTAIPIHNT